jgi:hypothetical protein
MSAGSTELAMSISEVRIIVRGSDGRALKWHSLLDFFNRGWLTLYA